tara:strand:- start:29 stop:505 length:477 start_codon:yes stop_codon:yes gene_type:complete
MSFTGDKDSDNHITPINIWTDIEKYIPKDKIIWSPFYCDGKQKEYFEEIGYNIIHEDKDFFSVQPEYDIIIDNPPFSKCKEVCVRLKELDKPFIIILPHHTFQYKRFQRPFKDHLQLIIPDKRMKFKSHIDNKLTNLPFDCYYFCYKMDLPKDIIWLE